MIFFIPAKGLFLRNGMNSVLLLEKRFFTKTVRKHAMTEVQLLDGIDLTRVLVQPLKEAFSPERIVLFGSQVWGTPDADSDVDIYVVVRSSNATPLERAVQAHKAVGMVPFAIDVIVQTSAEFERLRTVQGTLQHRIANEGRTIYEFTNE
jgi:uncharacterized protein